ncbi:MAG TPA: tetratricopeptide repeat protein [Phycisphaerae bacterium]
MSWILRHGWPILFCGASLAAADPPPDHLITKLPSRHIELEYAAPAEALPLSRVQFWYTLDGGQTWTDGGLDPDAQSPLTFQAPSDGLYGFFVVLTNATGCSSEPPKSGTPPQQWALIDAIPPAVQLHPAAVLPGPAGASTLAIRWTAVDGQLPARPVELSWRRWPDGAWQPLGVSLANTGRFDWTLPAGCPTPIQIRIAVRDRAENSASAESARIDLPATASSNVTNPGAPAGANPPGLTDDQTRLRARRLYQQGSLHHLRGEQQLAVSRFRDALRLDPTLTSALVELAAALYAQGAFEEAIEAYELALRQESHSPAALEGIAKAFLAKRDYTSAGRFLRQIVGSRPNDACAWLSLGDLAIYQGDEVQAREYYMKAATCDPHAADAAAAARLRLADLSEVSRPAAPNVASPLAARP